MAVNLRSLIGKLNAPTRSCVESAAGLCLSRTHYDVEIEHFLTKALDASDGDLAAILKHFGINRARLADDLARGLDRLKSGNARTPSLSPSLVKMLTEAWTLGSIEFAAPQVRIGLHAAEATEIADDYAGIGVHEAARVGALAEGGEILVTLSSIAPHDQRFTMGEERRVSLKGIAHPVRVAPIAWRPDV